MTYGAERCSRIPFNYSPGEYVALNQEFLTSSSNEVIPLLEAALASTNDVAHYYASSLLHHFYRSFDREFDYILRLLEHDDVRVQSRAMELIANISRDLREQGQTNKIEILKVRMCEFLIDGQDFTEGIRAGGGSPLRALGYLKDERLVPLLMEAVARRGRYSPYAARTLCDIVGDDPQWPREITGKGHDYARPAMQWWHKAGSQKQWPHHPEEDKVREALRNMDEDPHPILK